MAPQPLPALVIGAGPTGLAAAATLASRGMRVRIVDKTARRTDQSRALGVQSGTLECLQAAFGQPLVDEMLTTGVPVREGWLHFNDRPPVRMDLSVIPGRYNHILMLAQSETERLLEELLNRLEGRVERNTEFVDVQDGANAAVCTLKHTDGQVETVEAQYVVGCDGAHSAVRHAMGVAFQGGAYEGTFILGDVQLDWEWPRGSVQLFVSARGLIAALPLWPDGRYRLILVPKTEPAPDTAEISIDDFRGVLGRLSRDTIRVTDAHWLTRFKVHHRLVHSYRKGHLFLAGDAAHIHSPAGGQGMNTGIQDALNLGFKIADVLAGKRPDSVLDDYERERLPVARGVVRGTDFLFRMAIRKEGPAVNWIRGHVVPVVVGTRWIQRRAVTLVSEVAIARREIQRYPRR